MKTETRNALLAIALCLITIFIVKVALNERGMRDLSSLGANIQKSASPTATYTIDVSGSGGTAFQGNYMIVQPDGSSSSKSVEGIIPETYTIEGAVASCFFQKQSESGTLRITLRRNGNIVKEEETTATYGVVTLASQ